MDAIESKWKGLLARVLALATALGVSGYLACVAQQRNRAAQAVEPQPADAAPQANSEQPAYLPSSKVLILDSGDTEAATEVDPAFLFGSKSGLVEPSELFEAPQGEAAVEPEVDQALIDAWMSTSKSLSPDAVREILESRPPAEEPRQP